MAAGLLYFLASAPAWARDPIVIIENGARTSVDRQGLIGFAKDFEKNPRDLILEVLGHPFSFVTGGACGANCTSLTFISPELGINRTFTGVNTAEVSAAFKDYIKSSDFLAKFIRLINSGAGGQLSGGPTSTIGSTVRMTFQDTMFSQAQTLEQRLGARAGTDPQFSGGFAQFSSDGFGGNIITATPGFTLDFGARRDKHLKVCIPLAQIDLAGLKTYRAGLGLQYLYPVYLSEGWTLTLGPGLSYATTFSADLPNYSGLLGGAFSTSIQRDWQSTFATAAGYYGRFNNMGGIDAGIQANIYGWGLQGGYRLGQRWVTALHVVGIHERVAGFPVTTYHTISNSFSYKILNRFDITLSISKLTGLPKQRYVDFGLGSAWFF